MKSTTTTYGKPRGAGAAGTALEIKAGAVCDDARR